MIAYKLLRSDLSSLREEGRVVYSRKWKRVEGNGVYCAHTIPGLLMGGWGPVLAEVECKEPTGALEDGHVTTYRRVRILRTATLDPWAWARVAIRAAKRVARYSVDPRVAKAIAAAERCERERTPEAAMAARHAAVVAWNVVAAAAAAAAAWNAAVAAAVAGNAAEAAAAAGNAAAEAGNAAEKGLRASMADLVAEAWPKKEDHLIAEEMARGA